MRFYVIVIDVAAPGRSVHHLGITPGGVICGHRDNSAIGRNLRAGPRLPARTLIRSRATRRTPGPVAGAQRPAGAGTDMPFWVPVRPRRRAAGDAALPATGAARFTRPRVIGG